MKAFRQVKRLFLGILCDVRKIHCFRIWPWVKFNPDFKVSAFPIEENFHVLTFFFFPENKGVCFFLPLYHAHVDSNIQSFLIVNPRHF